MLPTLTAGPYALRGLSVGGVYTSIHVPALDVLLDVGVPLKSAAAVDRIFLSHAHPDHAAALPALLGIRRLLGKYTRPRVFAPAESADALRDTLAAAARLHRTPLDADVVGLSPGDAVHLGHDLHVRALRTHHGIPSLGYVFLRRVQKLKAAYLELPGQEIGRRRAAGEPLFDTAEHLELAYATDTRASVLDAEPQLLEARVLVLECTFLDARRTPAQAAEHGHLHLDELLERADRFRNEALVLMHFSQAYSPDGVRQALAERLPPGLRERTQALAPDGAHWFG